ncbi:uncharacterized protein [Lepeophtheirus salmonis]|uniref:uncharacterized protein isoform X1 n=1 Tax=Lepeophtheirus salmonis TaxID=72036 RepID=UPI001AE2EC59|nr:uncharacterized protein LOC121114008 isoform X1 [Lepeophtheirus salmonis]
MDKERDKFYVQGNEAFVAEDYAKAIDFYTQSLSQRSSPDPDVLISRCHAFIKAEKYKEAKSDADLVISLNPCDVKARLRCGIACFHMGKYKEAREAFSEGHKIDKNDSGFKQWIVWCDDKIKKIEQNHAENEPTSSPPLPSDSKKIDENSHSSESPKSPPVDDTPKITHGWYQTASSVVVEVRIKNLNGEDLKIEFRPTSIKTMPKNSSDEEDTLSDGILLNENAIIIKDKEHYLFSNDNNSAQPYWDCFRLIGPIKSSFSPENDIKFSTSDAIGSYCNLCRKIVQSGKITYHDLHEHLNTQHQDFLNGVIKDRSECSSTTRLSFDVSESISDHINYTSSSYHSGKSSPGKKDDELINAAALLNENTILFNNKKHHLFCNPVVRERLYWDFVRFIGPEKKNVRKGDKFTSSDAIGMFCLPCKKVLKYTKGNSNNLRRHMLKCHYNHLYYTNEDEQISDRTQSEHNDTTYSNDESCSVPEDSHSRKSSSDDNIYDGYLLSEDTVLYKNKEHYLFTNPKVRERLYWDFVRLVGPEKSYDSRKREFSSSDAIAMLCLPCNSFMKFVKGSSNIIRRHMIRFHKDYLVEHQDEDPIIEEATPVPKKRPKIELQDEGAKISFIEDSNCLFEICNSSEIEDGLTDGLFLSENSVLYNNKEHRLFTNPKVRERLYWDFVRLVGPEKLTSNDERRLSSSDAIAMYCIPCKKIMKFMKGNSNILRRHMKKYHQDHIDRQKENTKDEQLLEEHEIFIHSPKEESIEVENEESCHA